MKDASEASDFWSGNTVLVTGGCGFIGSHLVEALIANKANVWVLDNLQAGAPSNLTAVRDKVNLMLGDVRDSSCVGRVIELSQPRYVFHLAANASVPGSVKDPAYDFETNSAGTFVLLDALRRQDACTSSLSERRFRSSDGLMLYRSIDS